MTLGAIGAIVAAQVFVSVAAVSAAGPQTFITTLSGANENPPVPGAGTGTATITIAADELSISYNVTYSGLSGAVVAGHIHIGAVGVNGPVMLPFVIGPSPIAGTLTAADLKQVGGVTTFAGAVAAIKAGGTYVNLHTSANPGGEVRGQLNGPETYGATLQGSSEVPPVPGAGIGAATIVISPDATSISYNITYGGLSGPVVAAHIHVGSTAVAGPVILPFTIGPSPMTGTLTAADLKVAGGINTFADADRRHSRRQHVREPAHGDESGRRGPRPARAGRERPPVRDHGRQPVRRAGGQVVGVQRLLPARRDGRQRHHDLVRDPGLPYRDAPAGRHDRAAGQHGQRGRRGQMPDDTTPNKNGTTHSTLNFGALAPQGPTPTCGTILEPCVFDGSKPVSSGAPAGPGAPPFAVKINAPAGTYLFHCRVHVWMQATLTVLAAGSTTGVDTPQTVGAAVAAQTTAAVAAGTAAEAASSAAAVKTNANGTKTYTLRAGTSTTDGRVAILEFLPKNINIKKGDTVVWRPLDRQEIHTITFPKDTNTDMAILCEGATGDTPAKPTKIPPTGPQDFSCPAGTTLELENDGGNGVTNLTSPKKTSDSGIVAYRTVAAGFGLPASVFRSSWTATFKGAAPGVYHYVCQIHDGMVATITVKK